MEPLDAYENIQPLVQKEIDDKIATYFNTSRYKVIDIPAHEHNGVDSSRIDYNDLIGTTSTPEINSKMYADSQSITTAATITLNHSSIANGITNDTTNYKMIVQTAGNYFIQGIIGWDSPAADVLCRAYLRKNRSAFAQDMCHASAANLFIYNNVSDLVYLDINDEISLYGTLDAGTKSTLDTLQATKLLMFKV